ncbi:MAG: hypothetical protein GPJ51_13085 [Candidatus Heimdallarchaeota archaeon]|nr:hypothetical protein [Candidatus Heimdallarchaeota archaeon]
MCILLVITSSSIGIYSQEKTDNKLSIEGASNPVDTSLNYYVPTDFTWTDVTKINTDESALNETTSDDFFEYSISDSSIYIHELDTYQCWFGVYATIPVTNDCVHFSCDIRTTTGHNDVRNGNIRFYDPLTLLPIKNVPRFYNGIDQVNLDSGWDHLGGKVALPGYTEVIVFFYISDSYIADWSLQFWINNFKIYTNEESDVSQSLHSPIPLNYYDWHFGTFTKKSWASPNPSLTEISGGDFAYNVNSSHLIFQETGTGTYDCHAGAYSLIPVNQNFISFSFEGKVYSDTSLSTNLAVRVFDPVTKARLFPHPEIIHTGFSGVEVGFDYFEFNWTISGYDEVLLLFFYIDGDVENFNNTFWVRNFRHEIPIEYDDQSPLITGSDDFTVESGTFGNFVNWTVIDDNPDIYEIYRNDYLLDSDTWDSSEDISINIDYLADGIHNYTIIVYDTYGNYAKDTVLVTVIAYFESSYPFAILTILVLGICIISTVTRRKRKKEV